MAHSRPAAPGAGAAESLLACDNDGGTAPGVALSHVAFLTELAGDLGDAADEETALGVLAHGVVPALADWCALHVGPSADHLRRVVAVHFDVAGQALNLFVTGEKLREQSEESVALVETVFMRAPIGLGYVDTHLRYVRLNEHLAEMNGHPVAEHLGRTPRDVVPELADELEPICRGVLATGQPVIGREVSTRAGSGGSRQWVASYFPVTQSWSGSASWRAM